MRREISNSRKREFEPEPCETARDDSARGKINEHGEGSPERSGGNLPPSANDPRDQQFDHGGWVRPF
jgi:hypothetical protein